MQKSDKYIECIVKLVLFLLKYQKPIANKGMKYLTHNSNH